MVKGIAEGCRQAGCALIGGETAEMPGLYHAGDYDLAGFAVGAVERDAILPRDDIRAGDVVLGLASSGVHSNGYSLVRKIVQRSRPAVECGGAVRRDASWATRCSTPTRIYVKSCLAAMRETKAVKALAHITGGGFPDNIPRVLPEGLGARIDLARVPVPPVFRWLADGGRRRRARDAAHLQLRHRHDRGGRGRRGRRGHAARSCGEGETVVRLGEVVATTRRSRACRLSRAARSRLVNAWPRSASPS